MSVGAAYDQTKKLPAAVGPTPPLGTCCAGHGQKCEPNADWWQEKTWATLGFRVEDPHYYSYEFHV